MGQKIINVIIVLCVIIFAIFGVVFVNSNRSFTIARAHMLMAQGGYSRYEYEQASDEYNQIDMTRKVCIGVMVGSPILILCCIYIKSSSKNNVKLNDNNKIETSEEKLNKLKKLKESNLITEEYNSKRVDIIKNI